MLPRNKSRKRLNIFKAVYHVLIYIFTMFVVEIIRVMVMVFNATFNNISVISYRGVETIS
jgi:hypothetical protein